MPIRDAVAAHARSLVGLHAPDSRYVESIMPAAIETATNRAEAARCEPIVIDGRTVSPWSSCALVVRSVLRALGCEHPRLLAPYRLGMAMTDIEQIARELGAWREPSDHSIGCGDFAIVGMPPVAHGAPWTHLHAYTVTDLSPLAEGGTRVSSVDGGQVPHGTGIAARTRTWPPGEPWRDDVDAGAGAPAMRRWVYGWIACEAPGLGLVEPCAPTERAT